MSTYTLKVNFANYNPADTSPTVAGGAAAGINIFKQQFNSSTTIDFSTGTRLGVEDILEILNKILTCVKTTGANTEVLTTSVVDTEESHGSGSDPFNKLAKTGLTKDVNNEIYKLKPGYGLVFEVGQGDGNNTYYAYYCYVKELLEVPNGSTTPAENLWSIFITNKSRAPLIFDVQDERDIIFTVTGASGSEKIKSIDTTNFVFLSNGESGNGYKTSGYELKNTSFNLAVDDKGESLATINPMLSFKFNETA